MDREPREPREQILFKEEAYRIQGAVFEVNRHMGSGFLEGVYQECLSLKFAAQDIPFAAFPKVQLVYKGQLLQQTYSPDFICFERIIVELKAVRDIAPEHRAQVINYLHATGLQLGLLVNFGSSPKAQIQRLISSSNR